SRQLDSDEGALFSTRVVHTEPHGAYQFRNIVPPHLAYYLDRRVESTRDATVAQRMAGPFAVWVISMDREGPEPEILRPLPRTFPVYRNGRFLIVDLKPQRNRRFGE